MQFSPEQIAYALRKERVGGVSYVNLCADGETLLLPNLARYVELLAREGHYRAYEAWVEAGLPLDWDRQAFEAERKMDSKKRLAK